MPEPRRLIRRQPSRRGVAPSPAPARPTTGAPGASLTAAGNQAIQRSVVPRSETTTGLTTQELDAFIAHVKQAIAAVLGVSTNLSRSDFTFLSSGRFLSNSRRTRFAAQQAAHDACNVDPVAACANESDAATCQRQVRQRLADPNFCQRILGSTKRQATTQYFEHFTPLGLTGYANHRVSGPSWINAGSSTFSISNRMRTATLIHEAIHRIAHPGWNKDFPSNTRYKNVDEGAVQLMTWAVMDRLGPPFTANDAFSRPDQWSKATCALLLSGAPTIQSQLHFLRHAFFNDDATAKQMRRRLRAGTHQCRSGTATAAAEVVVGLATLGEYLVRQWVE